MSDSPQVLGQGPAANWLSLFESRRGLRHQRVDLPNQDCCRANSHRSGGYAITADGHGSAPHFRSRRGSYLAVRTLQKEFDAIRCASLDSNPRDLADALGRRVLTSWRRTVVEDLIANTPASSEAGVEYWRQNAPASAPDDSQIEDLRLAVSTSELDFGLCWDSDAEFNWAGRAYGSTLSGVFAIDRLLYFFRLGDGRAVSVVNGVGSDLIKDESLQLGDATPSLCSLNASREIVTGAAAIPEGSVGYVLTTDGVCNSYDDDAGFIAFNTELLDRLRNGSASKPKVAGWLRQLSKASGDDVSLATIYTKDE